MAKDYLRALAQGCYILVTWMPFLCMRRRPLCLPRSRPPCRPCAAAKQAAPRNPRARKKAAEEQRGSSQNGGDEHGAAEAGGAQAPKQVEDASGATEEGEDKEMSEHLCTPFLSAQMHAGLPRQHCSWKGFCNSPTAGGRVVVAPMPRLWLTSRRAVTPWFCTCMPMSKRKISEPAAVFGDCAATGNAADSAAACLRHAGPGDF